MPERFTMLWQHLAAPMGLITGLSAFVGVITADGVAASVTVVGLAFVFVLGKMSPVLAATLKEIGFALVEVRVKMKRELEATKAEVAETRAQGEENREAIEEVKRKAADEIAAARAEAARVKAEAESRIREVEASSSRKRHDLADQLNAQLLAARTEILSLKSQLGLTDQVHTEAINTVAENVKTIAEQMDPPVPVELPHLTPRSSDGE